MSASASLLIFSLFVLSVDSDIGTDCVCPAIHMPVCGKSGKTHGNECAAKCENDEVVCDNSCDKCGSERQEGCVCIEIYQPVCGKSGKTYSNSCHAKCDKDEIVCQERCVDCDYQFDVCACCESNAPDKCKTMRVDCHSCKRKKECQCCRDGCQGKDVDCERCEADGMLRNGGGNAAAKTILSAEIMALLLCLPAAARYTSTIML